MKYKITVFVLLSWVLTSIAFSSSFKPNFHLRQGELTPTPTSTPEPTPTSTPEPTPEASPQPTPTPDLELERLTREANLAAQKKAKAEADKDAAEAELKENKARLGLSDDAPQAAATPVSGNVTNDFGKLIETVILSETAAREASSNIADSVCKTAKPTGITTLVISNGTDMSAISNYQSILAQIQAINTAYETFLSESDKALERAGEMEKEIDNKKDLSSKFIPLPLAIPAATQIVKSAADFINLFRTETEFKSVSVSSVNDQMIATFLANKLLIERVDGCTITSIYYPSEYPINLSPTGSSSLLLKAFNSLRDNQTKGDQKAAKAKELADKFTLALDELKTKLKALEGKTDGSSKDKLKLGRIQRALLEEMIGRLNQLISDQSTFKTNTSDLIKMFSEINSTTKLPVLTEFLKAERLASVLDNDKTYAMNMTVTASGMVRIRRNIFFNATIAHSGGVSITVRLFNREGQMVGGDVQDYYFDFTGSKEIRKSLGFKKLSEVNKKPKN